MKKDINTVKQNICSWFSAEKRIAFLATIIVGLVAHMVVMTADWPNHDGLSSMYFDQNMITSGRWFLTVACGISSYFTIPWIIGVLGLIYLGVAAALLVDVLELKSKTACGIVAALLAVFPALASTFAYVFTMDGYMLGLLLAVAAVFVTKRLKLGWICGAFLLALSLGTYQAYLPFAVLLCIYSVILREAGSGSIAGKLKDCLKYLYMGAGGAALYYVILKLLLAAQGKVLDTYQGINGLEATAGNGIMSTISAMYKDFVSFSIKSRILAPNMFALVALVLLLAAFIYVFVKTAVRERWIKSIWLYITCVISIAVMPAAFNIVMLVSPDVNYHLIMRYQWVLIPIILVAFCDRFALAKAGPVRLLVPMAAGVLIFCYLLLDNIGYSNLNKKYEKTYAMSLRLLDRIEQTDGYYTGIPIAMIGVVGSDNYPTTDLTVGVTDNMIGLYGDYLLYKNLDYESFMKNYLGASLNFLSGDIIGEVYISDEYRAMGSFPAYDSVKIVNGIMYVKLENAED